jgi:nucleotide-binding universal stress UspA family protein
MKKIFLLLNGENTENMIHYGCHLAGLAKAKLVGIFPARLEYDYEPAMQMVYGMSYVEFVVAADEEGRQKIVRDIADDIVQFHHACESKGIRSGVKQYEHLEMHELAAETRFADLLIVDSKALSAGSQPRGHFSKELIKLIQCPVIITPPAFEPVNEVVFCYDSSPAALRAMKQFTYLFSEMEDVRATVLKVSEMDIAEQKRLRDWLCGYYDENNFVVLHGKTEETLFNYLSAKKNLLVVMGAYGRSALSRLVQHSHADVMIDKLPSAVFITH